MARSAAAVPLLVGLVQQLPGGVRSAMYDAETPYAVLWGEGTNGWYADPLEGGRLGGGGLSYDVAKWGITAYNHSGVGSGGGMAFSIDPGFPQLGNPICEPLGTTKAECHNASALEAYDPQHGGMPQAKEANLTAFLHRIRGIYSGRVPPDFEGVCNIDFEGCKSARSPIFSSLASLTNCGGGREYERLGMGLVRQRQLGERHALAGVPQRLPGVFHPARAARAP